MTHQFPSPGQPSSLSCSRSGSVCLSAYSPFSGSAEVYNRRVQTPPLDHLGQVDTIFTSLGCQGNYLGPPPRLLEGGRGGGKGQREV